MTRKKTETPDICPTCGQNGITVSKKGPLCSDPYHVAFIGGETPAIDAGSDVADGDRYNSRDPERSATAIGTFYIADLGKLPELERFAGGENMIGPIADVMFESGYFGDLTPAQIAVHILAGRSLGLDDAQSVFDLQIGPGPTITYKPGQPYQAAADAIERHRDFLRETIGDERRPDDADRATPKTTSPAADPDNVSAFPNYKPLKEANRGPLPIENPAGDESGVQVVPDDAGPQSSQAAGQLKPNDADQTPIDQETAADGSDPGSATPKKASPADPDIPKSVGAIADETGLIASTWRGGIAAMLKELGTDEVMIAKKLAKFDSGAMPGKREMFEHAQTYYHGKTDAVRARVIAALVADGKETAEHQKGFFTYADVSFDPADWTYVDAIKAENALSEFIGPPAAA